MAATIERQKADDPKALRARIAELSAQIGQLEKAKPAAPGLTKERESEIRKEAARSAHQQYLEPLGDAVLALEDFRRAADRLQTALELAHNVARFIDTITEPAKQRPQLPPPARIAPTQRAAPEASANGAVTGAAQRILDALAELEALGVAHAPRVQVAFMAGYTNLASKGFANAIGALRSGGHIDYPASGAIALTDSGRRQAQASNAPRTSEELQDRLISMLGGANGRIVRELVNVYPKSLPRENLAERAGYTNTASKGFANAIGRLRSLGFIDYPERGQIRAQDVLFLK